MPQDPWLKAASAWADFPTGGGPQVITPTAEPTRPYWVPEGWMYDAGSGTWRDPNESLPPPASVGAVPTTAPFSPQFERPNVPSGGGPLTPTFGAGNYWYVDPSARGAPGQPSWRPPEIPIAPDPRELINAAAGRQYLVEPGEGWTGRASAGIRQSDVNQAIQAMASEGFGGVDIPPAVMEPTPTTAPEITPPPGAGPEVGVFGGMPTYPGYTGYFGGAPYGGFDQFNFATAGTGADFTNPPPSDVTGFPADLGYFPGDVAPDYGNIPSNVPPNEVMYPNDLGYFPQDVPPNLGGITGAGYGGVGSLYSGYYPWDFDVTQAGTGAPPPPPPPPPTDVGTNLAYNAPSAATTAVNPELFPGGVWPGDEFAAPGPEPPVAPATEVPDVPRDPQTGLPLTGDPRAWTQNINTIPGAVLTPGQRMALPTNWRDSPIGALGRFLGGIPGAVGGMFGEPGYSSPDYLRSIGYQPGQGRESLWPGGPGSFAGAATGGESPGDVYRVANAAPNFIPMTGGVGGAGGSFFGGRGNLGMSLPGSFAGLGSGGGGSIGGWGRILGDQFLRHYLNFGPLSPSQWAAGTYSVANPEAAQLFGEAWGVRPQTYADYVSNMAAARPAIAAFLSGGRPGVHEGIIAGPGGAGKPMTKPV